MVQTNPDGGTVTYTRRAVGFQDETTATLSGPGVSQTTKTTQNSRGETVKIVDALIGAAPGHTSSYFYHPFGNLGEVDGPVISGTSFNKSTIAYDVRGNKMSETTPDRGTWTYTYDGLGEMLTQKDANQQGTNQATTIAYDVLGRVTSRSDPSLNRTFTYDTQLTGIGKLATACTTTTANAPNCSSGTIYSRTESYTPLGTNGAGQPSQTMVTQPGATANETRYASTSYDSYGRISARYYPSGLQVAYGYNTAGYLSTITDTSTSTLLWTANSRDAYLNLTQETYGNNVVTNQTFYPKTGRPNTVQIGAAGSIRSLSYTWDVAGNLSNRTDIVPAPTAATVNETFSYDALNRVLTSSVGGESINYDAEGNITYKSDVGTYTYPAAGSAQPHAVSMISGGAGVNSGAGLSGSISSPSYHYDANGNMYSGGGRTATYTAFNRTASVMVGSGTVTYSYDASDQRFKQVEPSATTLYWNAQGVTSEEVTNSMGTIWHNYITAGDETIGDAAGSIGSTLWGQAGLNWGSFNWTAAPLATQFYHTDNLGSIIALTDGGGTITEQDSYDLWGKRRGANGVDDPNDMMPASNANRGYTGQEPVGEFAWLNLNARMYDPQIGRFMSTDPKVDEPFTSQGWNRFAYVANNPLRSTDPTGEDLTEEVVVRCGCKRPYEDNYINANSVGSIGVTLSTFGSGGPSLSLSLGGATGTTTSNAGGATTAGESSKSNTRSGGDQVAQARPQSGRSGFDDGVYHPGTDDGRFIDTASGPGNNDKKQNTKQLNGDATEYNLPGAKLAYGGTYDSSKMAAAMTSDRAKDGQTVTVSYTKTDANGHTITTTISVVVNDTGPFARGSDGKALHPLRPDPVIVIDLTPTAMQALTGLERNRVPVTVTVPNE